MRRIKKILEELVSVEGSFKAEKEGVCIFCGKQGRLSKKVSKKVLKRTNNPAITLSISGDFPLICEDCSFVYENLTKISPRDLFSKGRFLVLDEGGSSFFIKNVEDLKNFKEGRYLILYLLKSGKKLPTNFYECMETSNPAKTVVINVIEGSKIYPVIYQTEDLIRKVKEKTYKEEFLINSIRKETANEGI